MARDRSKEHVLGASPQTIGGAKSGGDIASALLPPLDSGGSGGGGLVKTGAAPASFGEAAKRYGPAVAGAAVGALLWRDHWLLGALGGHALVSTAPRIYRGGGERRDGLCQLGVAGVGIAGSLAWDGHPFLGWLLGTALGLGATALVPGSVMRDEVDALKKKWKGG